MNGFHGFFLKVRSMGEFFDSKTMDVGDHVASGGHWDWSSLRSWGRCIGCWFGRFREEIVRMIATLCMIHMPKEPTRSKMILIFIYTHDYIHIIHVNCHLYVLKNTHIYVYIYIYTRIRTHTYTHTPTPSYTMHACIHYMHTYSTLKLSQEPNPKIFLCHFTLLRWVFQRVAAPFASAKA